MKIVKGKESQGLGFLREIDMICTCHELNVFNMVYAYISEDAITMTEAGVDCIVGHAGRTAGGAYENKRFKRG